jgi:hypothetical protein
LYPEVFIEGKLLRGSLITGIDSTQIIRIELSEKESTRVFYQT